MQLGIGSYTYGWSIGVESSLPPAPITEIDLIQRVLDFEISCLQLGDNLAVDTFSEERKLNLKSLCDKHDLRLELGARKLTAEHLDRYITLSTFFQAPLLRFVIDADGYEPNSSAVIDILKNALPDLQKNNITLCIENHDRFKAQSLASMMEAIGSMYVGICLDCVNSMGIGEGLEYVTDVLAPYTVNLHLKDFKVERLHHKMGFTVTGCPAGKGMINVPLILEKVLRYNRCQSAILEQWVPFQHTIETTVQIEKDWADESMKYLKSMSKFKFKRETVL